MSDTEELQRRNRELAILNDIANALSRKVDLTAALHTALAKVAELLDLRTGWIWLMRAETGESYLAAAQNLPPALVEKPRRMLGGCTCLDSYKQGDLEGAANVNVIECSRLWGLIDGTDGLRYHASIPLYGSNRAELGVLNVADTEWRELSAGELRLLYTIGDLVSIAIERARLVQRNTQLAAVEERNRLAREIHDTLAQSLAAIAMQLETADALMDAGVAPARVRQTLGRALDLSRTTLEEARRSVMDLRAAPLAGQNLSQAVEALIDRLGREEGVDTNFRFTGSDEALSVRLETGVYRVAQEALANVRRHAAAGRLDVALSIDAERLRLSVEDDGRGFDSEHIPQGHYGLVGMNERARLLGGYLRLQSCPGTGTRLELTVPLE